MKLCVLGVSLLALLFPGLCYGVEYHSASFAEVAAAVKDDDFKFQIVNPSSGRCLEFHHSLPGGTKGGAISKKPSISECASFFERAQQHWVYHAATQSIHPADYPEAYLRSDGHGGLELATVAEGFQRLLKPKARDLIASFMNDKCVSETGGHGATFLDCEAGDPRQMWQMKATKVSPLARQEVESKDLLLDNARRLVVAASTTGGSYDTTLLPVIYAQLNNASFPFQIANPASNSCLYFKGPANQPKLAFDVSFYGIEMKPCDSTFGDGNQLWTYNPSTQTLHPALHPEAFIFMTGFPQKPLNLGSEKSGIFQNVFIPHSGGLLETSGNQCLTTTGQHKGITQAACYSNNATQSWEMRAPHFPFHSEMPSIAPSAVPTQTPPTQLPTAAPSTGPYSYETALLPEIYAQLNNSSFQFQIANPASHRCLYFKGPVNQPKLAFDVSFYGIEMKPCDSTFGDGTQLWTYNPSTQTLHPALHPEAFIFMTGFPQKPLNLGSAKSGVFNNLLTPHAGGLIETSGNQCLMSTGQHYGITQATCYSNNATQSWEMRAPHFPFHSEMPSTAPSMVPSQHQTDWPSYQPSSQPSMCPSLRPSKTPTGSPTGSPSPQLTASPTVSPTASPSSSPTAGPTGSPTRNPTAPPTGYPTTSPSGTPTAPPTASPTQGANASPPPTQSNQQSGQQLSVVNSNYNVKGTGTGDPHFANFGGVKFDFHGGCDLVFLHVPNFTDDGKNLTVHIRTRIETWWSFIEAVSVRIGRDTLEVMGGDHKHGNRYWINGEAGHDFGTTLKMNPLESTLAEYEIGARKISNMQRLFRVQLSEKDGISIQTRKDFVTVTVLANTKEMFEQSVGLMGSFPDGKMLSREGVVVQDVDEYGKGWQVLSTEPKLFHSYEGTVQHPEMCAMPDLGATTKKRRKRRRLGESMLTEEAAELACTGVGPKNFDFCVSDVLAVQDKDVANVYKVGPGAY